MLFFSSEDSARLPFVCSGRFHSWSKHGIPFVRHLAGTFHRLPCAKLHWNRSEFLCRYPSPRTWPAHCGESQTNVCLIVHRNISWYTAQPFLAVFNVWGLFWAPPPHPRFWGQWSVPNMLKPLSALLSKPRGLGVMAFKEKQGPLKSR